MDKLWTVEGSVVDFSNTRDLKVAGKRIRLSLLNSGETIANLVNAMNNMSLQAISLRERLDILSCVGLTIDDIAAGLIIGYEIGTLPSVKRFRLIGLALVRLGYSDEQIQESTVLKELDSLEWDHLMRAVILKGF